MKASVRMEQTPDSPEPSCVSMKADQSNQHSVNFKQSADGRGQLETSEFFSDQSKQHQTDLDSMSEYGDQRISQHKLKSNLKERFQCVLKGNTKAGNPDPLNQIYTELYITEGGTGEIKDEHKVRQMETTSMKPHRPETTIRHEDIFKTPPGRDKLIRTVMTKGVAGIGKTVLTQKFTLDWAEDKANQDILFTFPFTFRELNVLKEKKFSLVELIYYFFPETKEAGLSRFEEFQVVFILDGLDECRLPLDFHKTEILTDVTEPTSVDVLLINLIRGKLLPSAHLWITTRPAAANQIPSGCVDMVTEVRGFTDPQKEEYFRKRFRDEEQASTIISHMKTSRSLHIMCHIPVFCWITATVLEDLLKTREGGKLPKTMTEMLIYFLVVQCKQKSIKYDRRAETDPLWSPENRKMIESLGKLAFEQQQKGNLIFYEPDLTECGVDIRAVSMYSGVFTQEIGLYQDKVFSFIHLSVQEFLAALHVHLTFINSGVNLMADEQTPSRSTITQLYQSAVDQALLSPNGHLDLFLRFLMGLSLTTNQKLLQGLLKQTGSDSETKLETVQYIETKISEDLSAEKSINLFHCLNELNERSLVEHIQQSLRSGSFSTKELSPAQWSALVFILLSSEKDLEVFDLKKYSASEEALLRLLPVVKASNKALLNGCNLSVRGFKALSSVLSSQSSSLRELDLSDIYLMDSGIQQLWCGLTYQQSKLESLKLRCCNLSERSCGFLASVLCSSSLRELDLSDNKLQDSGIEQLLRGVINPHSTLESLRLRCCNLSERSCGPLSLALSSKSSSLRALDLSNNDLQNSGFEQLLCGVIDPHCKLESLGLRCCNLSEKSCGFLASALSSSSLRELDLSDNNLQDSGVEHLMRGVIASHCKLESLRLSGCNLSERSCGALSLVLNFQSSSLRELDLSNNDLQDSGIEQLWCGFTYPHSKLESLRLTCCKLSERSCGFLASALSSSSLRELDLSDNNLQDSGVEHLMCGVIASHCKLESLRLSGCNLSERSCGALSLVLSSQSSSLRELDLSNNDLQDSGIEQLWCGFTYPHSKLESLRLTCCKLSERSCSFLSSVLSSSSLRELDLSNNGLQDSGVELLCGRLRDPHSTLESLRLSGCLLSKRSCGALSSVLSSQSSSLKELDLSNNDLQDSGIEQLWCGLLYPQSKLESLRLSGCNLSERSCGALSLVFSSQSSNLRELDLSNNNLQDSGVRLLSSGRESPYSTGSCNNKDNCVKGQMS